MVFGKYTYENPSMMLTELMVRRSFPVDVSPPAAEIRRWITCMPRVELHLLGQPHCNGAYN